MILLSILCQTFVLSAFADEGTLDSAKPTGITAEEIIQRFVDLHVYIHIDLNRIHRVVGVDA